jgi:hypothetical protein
MNPGPARDPRIVGRAGSSRVALDAPPGVSTFRSSGTTLVVLGAGAAGGRANATARRPPAPRRA